MWRFLASKRLSLLVLVGTGLASLIVAMNATALENSIGRRGVRVGVLLLPFLALTWFGISLLLDALETGARPRFETSIRIAGSLLLLLGGAILLIVVLTRVL